jgi:hypothetical protein
MIAEMLAECRQMDRRVSRKDGVRTTDACLAAPNSTQAS